MPENAGGQYTGSAGNQTHKKLKRFTHLHSNKLACLNPNPQKSAIGGKTNKSEIGGGGSSFVKKERGPVEGLDPPEFSMNTERRAESTAKWTLKTDARNKGTKGREHKSQKSNTTQALGLSLQGLGTSSHQRSVHWHVDDYLRDKEQIKKEKERNPALHLAQMCLHRSTKQ